jgi:hypothetical protein
MFNQEHTSSQEAQQRFTSQEAGDILNIAARFSNDSFSQEQLEAIAEEAGIPREAIYRAIQEHQRQIQAGMEKKRLREERRRHWHRILPLALLIIVTLVTALALFFAFAQPPSAAREMSIIRIERSGINMPPMPRIELNLPSDTMETSETDERPEISTQEVTGRTKRVYTRPAKQIPFSFSTQSIYVEDLNTGETITAVPEAKEVHHLTLSPSENQLAYFTGKTSNKSTDLWVVNTDGTKLCHITGEGGVLKLSDGRTASVKGTEVMWADDNTLITDTNLGRMEIDLDKNNVPHTVRFYEPRQ